MADENTSLQIGMIEIDGTLHAPIFTSVERISVVVSQEVGFAAMKGDALLAILRGKDLVMNPGAEYGKIFTAHEVEAICSGSLFNPAKLQVGGGKQILLGQPKDYPRHITEALSRLFARSRDVKVAYLAHAFIPDVDQAPHTLIGVEVVRNGREVVGEACAVVREVAKQGEMVNFVQLHPQTSDTIADYMRQQTTPFYVRKRWFGLF